METSLRHDAPVVFIVDNNDGIMGATLEKSMFSEQPRERVARYLPGIRYDRIIEAFGGRAVHLTDPDEVRPAVAEALKADRSTCIDISVDPTVGMPGVSSSRGNAMMGY
jgi:thiamine pyrophosphate-dependent acetolactate synthase large subunit-like protein